MLGGDSSYINIDVPELMFEANITENHLTFPAWEYNSSSDTFIIITDKDDQENNTGIYTDVGQHLYIFQYYSLGRPYP